ncbi:MAG: 3-methyl-2-oxobutanoate hydroxymethyltransferase, partial [Candidatus Hadarchaeales archaeon]
CMLTAYDYPSARLLDEAGVEVILVGDSVGNVLLGYPSTLPVTMEEMLHHTRAVARGVKRALVVGDMPFLSYQPSDSEGVLNAGRFIKAGAEAVKVEGGTPVMGRIKAMLDAGIPVMGHLGLTPQWIHQFGGYRVRAKTADAARVLLREAKELEKLGVFSLVLEGIPWQVAKLITENLEIPTIGIGAGPYCDGQVLVLHDMLGISGRVPKFVKKYANLGEEMRKAVLEFMREVKEGKFPTMEFSYEMPREEAEKLEKG